MKKANLKVHLVRKSKDFVGIKMDSNNIDLYVPQVFRLNIIENEYTKETKKDLLLFLKSIYIAKTIDHEQIKKDNGNEWKDAWPIESYLWIVQDYIENGYFYNREKIYSNARNGKIDWKRTIKTVPIFSGGNIIYDKLVTSKMTASNDIIAQIYKICLTQSVNRIGWAFNYNIRVDVQQIISKKEMIYIITNELKNAFDDVKRLRFGHMLKILKNISGENALSNKFTYGVENYYYVFEVMVDNLFSGINGKEKERYYPSGYWLLNNQKELKSSNLRPDTIYRRKKSNETFIIDAKMYQYGFTKNVGDLPKTSSMQKQITYGDYVHNYVDLNSKVRNAFILPFNKELFKGDPNVEFNEDLNVGYIGFARVDFRNTRNEQDYDYIYAFMIDFNFLLNNYKKDESKYINYLCKKINEKIKHNSKKND